MKTTTMYFENHPLIGFLLSAILTALGFGIGGDLHLQVHAPSSGGLPDMVKDIFQCIAWSGAGVTGFVAGHGFWVKNIRPLIQNAKEKRKSSKK